MAWEKFKLSWKQESQIESMFPGYSLEALRWQLSRLPVKDVIVTRRCLYVLERRRHGKLFIRKFSLLFQDEDSPSTLITYLGFENLSPLDRMGGINLYLPAIDETDALELWDILKRHPNEEIMFQKCLAKILKMYMREALYYFLIKEPTYCRIINLDKDRCEKFLQQIK